MNNTSVNLFNNGVVKIIPPKMAKKKLIKLAIFIPPILAFFKPPLTLDICKQRKKGTGL